LPNPIWSRGETGYFGRWLTFQERLDLLLNLNKPDATFFVAVLGRIARVFDLSVLSDCLLYRLDLTLQLAYFLGDGGSGSHLK
jgi:hypothetical protein